MENKKFDELVQDMRNFFKVNSIESVAEKFNKSRDTGSTWRNRKSIPYKVIAEFNRLKAMKSEDSVFLDKRANITYYPNIKASAGYGFINDDEYSVSVDTELLDTLKVASKKNLEMIQIQGESMMPYVNNGDFAIIERTTDVRNGDIVVFNFQNDLYIKQLQKNPQTKTLSFVSSNTAFPSFSVMGDELESLLIIGVLKSVVKCF